MFTDNYNLNQIVKDKQIRFQAQAAQERLIKACATTPPTGELEVQPKRRRPGLLRFRFRLAKHSGQ